MGRRESTGFGVAAVALAALKKLGIEKTKATAAVQGFGKVGCWAAVRLFNEGCKVVAVSDISGGLYRKEGLDIKALYDYVQTSPRHLIAGYEEPESSPSATTTC